MVTTTVLVKHEHACVRVVRDGTALLFDPGTLGPPPSLIGVGAILISHGHYDHVRRDVLLEASRRGISIYGPSDSLPAIGAHVGMAVLSAGERVTISGFSVTVVGGRHAKMHPHRQGPENLGYLLDGRILITGDEHPDVTGDIDVLVTPIDAPWLCESDLIEYVQRVRPRLLVGVHDGLLNDAGLVVADSVLATLKSEGAGDVVRPRVGQALPLEIS